MVKFEAQTFLCSSGGGLGLGSVSIRLGPDIKWHLWNYKNGTKPTECKSSLSIVGPGTWWQMLSSQDKTQSCSYLIFHLNKAEILRTLKVHRQFAAGPACCAHLWGGRPQRQLHSQVLGNCCTFHHHVTFSSSESMETPFTGIKVQLLKETFPSESSRVPLLASEQRAVGRPMAPGSSKGGQAHLLHPTAFILSLSLRGQ